MKPKIVVVTGMDGAGKSTLLKRVHAEILDQGVSCVTCSIWDNLGVLPLKSKSEIQSYLSTLEVKSRLLFLSHAMMNSLEKAISKQPDIILVDSFIYKYLVNERVRGITHKFTDQVLQIFPRPNQVFFLQIDPEVALARKETFSDYESDGDFLRFQEKMVPVWMELAGHCGNWQVLNGEESVDRLASLVVERIVR